MEYYNIDIDYTPSITGKRDGDGDVLELRGKRDFIPFRFQGMYYDTETELCYVRHRYYPFGKQKGTGLTPDERAAFNKWKQEYWKSQAEAKLKARGKK